MISVAKEADVNHMFGVEAFRDTSTTNAEQQRPGEQPRLVSFAKSGYPATQAYVL